MTSYVYFMQSEGGGPVKIGKADDPERRRRELQTGRPDTLIVLGTIRCRNDNAAYELENDLHKRFEHYHLNLEWFELGPELAVYLAGKGFLRTNPLKVFVDYLKAAVQLWRA